MSERPRGSRDAATRALRRGGSALVWYGLPGIALALVFAYVLYAAIDHVNPPAVPVEGTSMRPALQAGDLVLLKSVDPTKLRKGDIVAVDVPEEAQRKYGLPGHVVHRIVRIEHDAGGELFVTRGDANSGNDVFTTRPTDVAGEMAKRLPMLGYPVLFFRSTEGLVFLGATLLVVVAYFLLGVFEERHVHLASTAVGMQAVLGERRELDKLVAAVGEYGEHLRSHTAVMRGLAQTTVELQRATERLHLSVADPVPVPAVQPPQPPPTSRPAEYSDYNAALLDLWRQRRALEVGLAMGFRDPLDAAARAPLGGARDDRGVEQALWALALESPHLLA